MTDIQTTKIIVLRGISDDLPKDLDAGELGFSTDEGRLFIGCDPTSGQRQYGRSEFPFRNIEVMTENSNALFQRMHSERMREGGGDDYYNVRLLANTFKWSPVLVDVSDDTREYTVPGIKSVAMFIDYSVVDHDGVPLRMGTMSLTHYPDYAGEPYLIDNGSYRRDLSRVDSDNYDPSQVFSQVLFRFVVDGPENVPYLAFQYKNLTSDVVNLRFKVSRPEANFYEHTRPFDEPE